MTRQSARLIYQCKVPGTSVSILTATTKMPGPSFSLPAGRSCPNARGTVCENCYAQKNCYSYPSVRNAQSVRFDWTRDAMRTSNGRMVWIERITEAIETSEAKWFRIHDSGDFFSVPYTESWYYVCTLMPHVRFWAPTREYQTKCQPAGVFAVLQANPRLEMLRRMAELPNVTVRPSALEIGETVPVVAGLHAGSGVAVAAGVSHCGAYKRSGQCGACRICWTRKDVAVSYPLH